MNTTELIEIAKECCFSRQVVGDETTLITFRSEQLQQFAQRIEQPHLQRIAELELALQKQAKAALHGMDAAKTSATAMLKVATETQSQLNPELIESERQANAVLTEENERLQQQIEQLREALQLIKIKDENKMYQSCPDCDYPGTCKSDMVCKSMPRSSIGNIAHKVLEETK